MLDDRDAHGMSRREALVAIGCNADAIPAEARSPATALAYIEVHIEQGPVLEAEDLPVGIVTAISGATRGFVEVYGETGHAGTVPMLGRRDALAAAAEMILAVERTGETASDLVATVGRVGALPGAQNVIPGRVAFTIDMRSPSDAVRDRAHAGAAVGARGDRRAPLSVKVDIDTYQRNAATALDPMVIDAAADAIAACGQAPLRLASGAGHDAMIMARHCPSGMIFVRCKGGISHNPAESITVADADLGVRALLEAVRRLDQRLA